MFGHKREREREQVINLRPLSRTCNYDNTKKFIKFLSHLLFFKKFKENPGPITCIAVNNDPK